jgi:peptidoglycan hydrolase-like protein with peptidoglycan-binding domain
VRKVQIHGHADVDTPPNPKREKQMSEERARMVRDWLQKDVGSSIAAQINWKETQGFGATKLRAQPTTEANRRQNRRVEITLVRTPQPVQPVCQAPERNPNLVKWLKQSLNQILGLRLPVNGNFDVMTRRALQSYQKRRKLSSTGTLDRATQLALYSDGGKEAPCTIDSVDPVMDVFPQNFAFKRAEGSDQPAQGKIGISNLGSGTLVWQGTTTAPWLTISPSSGSVVKGPDEINVSANPKGLPPGEHKATIILSAPNAINSPQSVSVSLTIIREQLCKTNFLPSEKGFKFSNNDLTITIIQKNTGFRTNACGGMVFLALDYWLFGSPPPGNAKAPRPLDPLFRKLYKRQQESVTTGPPTGPSRIGNWQKYLQRTQLTEVGPGSCAELSAKELREILRPLCERVESNKPREPIPIGLMFKQDLNLTSNHVVLVYGAEQTNPKLYLLHVYDPNYPNRDDIRIQVNVNYLIAEAREEAIATEIIPGKPPKKIPGGFFKLFYTYKHPL